LKKSLKAIAIGSILAVAIAFTGGYISNVNAENNVLPLDDTHKLSKERQEEVKKRNAEINAFFDDLNQKKVKSKVIKRKIEEHKEKNKNYDKLQNKLTIIENEIKNLKDNAKKSAGLREVTNGPKLEPAYSSNTALSMDAKFYEDIWTSNSNDYVAVFDLDWTNYSWSEDEWGDGEVGGEDGFVQGFNQKIYKYGDSFDLYWYIDGTKSTSTTTISEERVSEGYGWKWQDIVRTRGEYGEDFNAGYATATLYIEFDSDISKVEQYGNYGHTWSFTSVSGFNAGWPPSVTFDSTSSYWKDSHSEIVYP
jgi:Skp family chaperone for outer membrane proteins